MNITVMTVATNANAYSPFTKFVPHSGLSMVCKVALANGTILSSGTSTYNSGTDTLDLVMDFNTAEMVAAITGQTSISPYIEFELNDGSNKLTAYQATITVKKEYIVSGAASPNPLDVYLTESQSNGRFVRKIGQAGESITLMSPDGTKQCLLYIDNAGAFHADTI